MTRGTRSGSNDLAEVKRGVKDYFDERASALETSKAPQDSDKVLVARLMSGRVRGDVLELGCGMTPSMSMRPGQDRLVALDLSRASLGHVAGAWGRVCGDAGRMPFAPASFDGAVSAHVFHHMVGRDAVESRQLLHAVVEELARVMRPGGVVALADTVLAGPFSRLERAIFAMVRVAAWALSVPAVMFRSARSLESAFTGGGFQVREAVTLPTRGKPLTPWKSSLRWPMAWSPLRDVFLVFQRVE
jgi:SAM-dependent methyltransferase